MKENKVDEVCVFGTDKYVLYKNRRMEYDTGLGRMVSRHSAKIFNEKTGEWEFYPVNEALIDCPVCGKRLKAYYIPGTTWLACCSEECYKKLDEKVKELGSIWEALSFFEERGR